MLEHTLGRTVNKPGRAVCKSYGRIDPPTELISQCQATVNLRSHSRRGKTENLPPVSNILLSPNKCPLFENQNMVTIGTY